MSIKYFVVYPSEIREGDVLIGILGGEAVVTGPAVGLYSTYDVPTEFGCINLPRSKTLMVER